ncbi:MAG: hypothetical protein A2X86_12145 [Bdellovibrionales bacterium GWA2_49_15]|nr:MAG: hypothetical protein A2X86_12145 [Bdellovibrionales bacterium GWA2_49_15]
MEDRVFEKLNSQAHTRVETKRFVLYTGFACNLRCQFCYYLKSLEDGTAENFSAASLKRKIYIAHLFGKTAIDFTGGEATLHPQFKELVSYAKGLGFKVINVITNGWKLADLKFFQGLRDAGLNEVLFSLHSHLEELHDELTKIAGSQRKILKAISNAHELNVRVRLNSVVTGKNAHEVSNFLEYAKTLKPHSVNLIVFNPTEETVGYKNHDSIRISTYEEIGRLISQALDQYKTFFPVVNVRFLSFCYLRGHEDVIRTYWQEIYEAEEWDPILHWAFRKNWLFALAATIVGILIFPFKQAHLFFGKKGFYVRLCEHFQNFRILYLYRRPAKCATCSLKLICPGLPKDFYKTNPNAQVFPYSANEYPLVKNPVLFGHKYPNKFPATAHDLK